MPDQEPQVHENTIPYEGDINDLPHCALCSEGVGNAHTFLTYEHPYEMRDLQ